MRQRHSFHRMFFHLVFTTKHRQPVIQFADDERGLQETFRVKAHELDAFIEEVGTWVDHVHVLFRAGPSRPLSQLYGQIKGFSARAWNLRHPDRALSWSDGVYIATVDPDETRALREYIRAQRVHHERRTQIARWEPVED